MSTKRCVFPLSALLLVGTAAMFLMGCADDELTGTLRDNQPPQVWLVVAPPEGSIGCYKVNIAWGGWDPDGEIAYYEYAVTDNESGVFDPADTTGAGHWHKVFRNDSVFTFSADLPADSSDIDPEDLKPVEFRRSHTFFIRAVDEKGLASRRPAYRSFTSKTLSPVVDILVPPDMTPSPTPVTSIVTFQWVGEDYVTTLDETQEPDSVRWILVPIELFNDDWAVTLEYIRGNPGAPEWSDWAGYASHTNWTTPPLEWGGYVFAVQVMDEAGAASPVYDEARNVRRILVGETSPPVLTVYNEFVGPVAATGVDGAPVILDLPAGLPVSFRFMASTAAYGGIVVGYRYGWNTDLKDIPFTPFVTEDNSAQSAPWVVGSSGFDSEAFDLEVIDGSGFRTQLRIRVYSVPMTAAKDLLVVDDWAEPFPGGFAETNGATPSDIEHDEFWMSVLDGVEGFDPVVDMIDVTGVTDLPIQMLADYQSVIWSAPGLPAAGDAPLLSKIIGFVDPNRPTSTADPHVNVLAAYMAAGGHVMLCGETIMTNAVRTVFFPSAMPAFPLIFRYELGRDQDGDYEDSIVGERGIGEHSFAYGAACLDVLDMAVVSNPYRPRRDPPEICSVDDLRDYDARTQGLRSAVPYPAITSFPELTLRPEVADPGKSYAEENAGLNCDIYNPAYFRDLCSRVGDFLRPPRGCFVPIYGHECLDTGSVIYGAPVAYWTSTYEDRVPGAGGVGAKGVIWGFHPVYFNPAEVKAAMGLILYDEWMLPRKTP